MKRLLSILLCLMLVFSVTACKPDNITYPAEITNPNAAPEDPGNAEAGEETGTETDKPAETPEDPTNETTEDLPADTPITNEEVAEDPADAEESPAEGEALAGDAEETPTAPVNPLAAEDFQPSAGVGSALTASGLIKPVDAAHALKNRTITLYTAGSNAAFQYADEKGNTISEWDWMAELAAEQGFMLKLSIKSDKVSLKSQRVALWAGIKLSLIQMRGSELADGLTLARSAEDYLDMEAASFGISKAVLEQSDHTLLAPVGSADTLWYHAALLPAGTDLATTIADGKWTVEQFKALSETVAANKVMPLRMEQTLAWATLSGKSPLTLLEGKLDSNINARVTRPVWEAVGGLPAFTPEEGTEYALKNSNLLMEYTHLPETTEGLTLTYAPLPALEEGAANPVTFTGTFVALPKYNADAETDLAALTFAELWCNRYTETRAAALQALGVTGADYQAYCDLTEANGALILHCPAIETLMEPYFNGITDEEADLQDLYDELRDPLMALIAARNLYY